MENGKNFPPDTIPRIEEEKRETGPPPEAPVPTPLTEPQRRFAAQYHALIYGFLLEKKLEIREYYDIAAIGYLHAVQRYALSFGKETVQVIDTSEWMGRSYELIAVLYTHKPTGFQFANYCIRPAGIISSSSRHDLLLYDWTEHQPGADSY